MSSVKKNQYEDYSLTYQSTVLRQADRANDMMERLFNSNPATSTSDIMTNIMNFALTLDGLEGMIKQYILREVSIEELEKVQLTEEDFKILSSQGDWRYGNAWKVIRKLMTKYYVLLRHFTYIGIAPKIKINLDMATEDIKRDRILKLLEDTLEDSPNGKEWFEETCVRISRRVIAKSNPKDDPLEIDQEETLTELEA